MTDHLMWAWPCGHEVQPDEIQCMACRAANAYGPRDEAQGEAVRLFTPAPNQIPGQLAL